MFDAVANEPMSVRDYFSEYAGTRGGGITSGPFTFTALSNYAAGGPSLSADQERARRDMKAMADLRTGWDGEGAPAISPITLAEASSALEQLLARAPAPDIVPNINGTISFEWETDLGYAHLEIGSQSYSFLLARKLTGKRVGARGRLPASADYICRLLSAELYAAAGNSSTTVIVYAV